LDGCLQWHHKLVSANLEAAEHRDAPRRGLAAIPNRKCNGAGNIGDESESGQALERYVRTRGSDHGVPGELIALLGYPVALLRRSQGALIVLSCLLIAFFKRDNLPAQVVQAATTQEDRGKSSDRRPVYSIMFGGISLLLVVWVAYLALGIQISRGRTWGFIAVLSAFGLVVYCIADRLLFDRYWWRRGLRSDNRSADREKEDN